MNCGIEIFDSEFEYYRTQIAAKICSPFQFAGLFKVCALLKRRFQSELPLHRTFVKRFLSLSLSRLCIVRAQLRTAFLWHFWPPDSPR